ncbi:MAG: hypothetical protein FWF28_01045 [Micrococcales bacterium]|nr:hypothetical protein [Micrococcales bacterium]
MIGTLLSEDPAAEDGAADAVHVVLARSQDAANVAAFASRNSAWIVALHQGEPNDRPWPGWHGELLAAGYIACLFTGTWRLYVAANHAAAIGTALSYPAEIQFDEPSTVNQLRADLIAWRTKALDGWAEVALGCHGDRPDMQQQEHALQVELQAVRAELDATRRTLSWRVTRPLRAVRSLRQVVRR